MHTAVSQVNTHGHFTTNPDIQRAGAYPGYWAFHVYKLKWVEATVACVRERGACTLIQARACVARSISGLMV